LFSIIVLNLVQLKQHCGPLFSHSLCKYLHAVQTSININASCILYSIYLQTISYQIMGTRFTSKCRAQASTNMHSNMVVNSSSSQRWQNY